MNHDSLEKGELNADADIQPMADDYHSPASTSKELTDVSHESQGRDRWVISATTIPRIEVQLAASSSYSDCASYIETRSVVKGSPDWLFLDTLLV